MIKRAEAAGGDGTKPWPKPMDNGEKARKELVPLPFKRGETEQQQKKEAKGEHRYRKLNRAKQLYQERQAQRLFQIRQQNQSGYSRTLGRRLDTRSQDSSSSRKIYISINGKVKPYSPQRFSELTKRHGLQVQYLSELIFSDEEILQRFAPSEAHGPQLEPDFQPPVYIEFIDDEIGWGLYALCDIEKGGVIGEYTGVVGLVGSGNPYTMFYSPRHEDLIIDATFFGNETRYINHSEDYNCEFGFTRSSDGLDHRLFVATRDIPKGHQILTDYGPKYWEGLTPKKL